MNTIEMAKPAPVLASQAQGLAFALPYTRHTTFKQKFIAILEILGAI